MSQTYRNPIPCLKLKVFIVSTFEKTRTTSFWDTPAAPWLTILLIHIRSQVKTRQILQETLQATHLLKLLDKMYKYDMDPIRTVGTTERTRDGGRTDGLTDGVKPIPLQLHCVEGIINHVYYGATLYHGFWLTLRPAGPCSPCMPLLPFNPGKPWKN